ncbi:hypothetical protein V6N13_123116 [Hibiscus sabdariffa]
MGVTVPDSFDGMENSFTLRERMGNFRKFGGVSSPLHVEPEVNKAMSGSNEFFSSTFRRVIKISIREVLKEPTLHADSTIPAACAGEQNIIMKPMQFGR